MESKSFMGRCSCVKRTAPRLLLLAATLLAAGRAHPAENIQGPLRVPKQIVLDYVPGKTNYTITYFATNTANTRVGIEGYTASCQCTSVEASDFSIPPGGQTKIRATVAQHEPTLQYVLLRDTTTNTYQTIIWIRPMQEPAKANEKK